MSHVAPVMAIVTAIISIAMDPWHDFSASHIFDSSAHIIRSSLLLLAVAVPSQKRFTAGGVGRFRR
jgi:hypothetical protein